MAKCYLSCFARRGYPNLPASVAPQDEARFVFEKDSKELIFGTGQYGNPALSPEAAAFLI